MYQAPQYLSWKRSLLAHCPVSFATWSVRAGSFVAYLTSYATCEFSSCLFVSLKLLVSPLVPMLRTKFSVALSVSLEISSAQDSAF